MVHVLRMALNSARVLMHHTRPIFIMQRKRIVDILAHQQQQDEND